MSSLNLPPVVRNSKPEQEVIPDYLYTKDEVLTLFTPSSTERIFGKPGASLTWGIGGIRHSDVLVAGKEGENATGKVLAELSSKLPELYVFHSLRWPESNGDTDHAIVYKNLVMIIDTKRWKGSRKYSITIKGEIKRGTVPFPEGKVKIGGALQVWRRKVPQALIKGVVAIAQEKVFVVRDHNWYKAPYRLVEQEKLDQYIVETIEKHKVPADYLGNRKILETFASLLVKPRDPRAGLIQGNTENPFKR